MKTFLLGTKNKDKCAELQKLLSKSGYQVDSLKSFPDIPEAVENGRTFLANAKIKARLYSKLTKLLTLADDSGLMVNVLNGKPGVYSARFAGENCSYDDNNKKLLRLLKKIPEAKRRAKFVCVMALYDKGRFIKAFRGECKGRIALDNKGKNGFGYDPVFIPEGFAKTFAEITPEEKNRVSHRGKALRLAANFLRNYRA